jgi:DNA-binding MarR family transcriptional regulator
MSPSRRKSSLTEQALLLSQLTRNLARCCQVKEEQIFGKFNLTTTEGRVLLEVAEGPCTASELADRMNLVRSRLSPLVESLVGKGLLLRVDSEKDRRVHNLSLTASGQAIALDATAFQISFHEQLLKRFEVTRRRDLLNSLDELHSAIEDLRSLIAPPAE